MVSRETQLRIQRDMLTSVILQLHPTTQPLKSRVMAKIIARVFLDDPDNDVLAISEIQQKLAEKYGIHFTISRIRDIVNKSEIFERIDKDGYRLSSKFRDTIRMAEEESMKRYERVIQSLFGKDVDINLYLPPFLDFLSRVFSRISEEYVRLLKGDADDLDVVGREYFQKCLRDIAEQYDTIDSEKFEYGIIRFFKYPDPDYDYIKWTTAQSYYLLKAVGLDPKGHLLSEDKFKEGAFYLDTNILIAYIFEEHPHHLSAQYLIGIIQSKLKGKIKVAQITLDEFDSWFEYKISMLTRTSQVIPRRTIPKVREVVLSEYQRYIETAPSPDKRNIDGFVNEINERLSTLKRSLDIVDNPWFGEAATAEDVKKISDKLRNKYLLLRKENKSPQAALHDARILKWIDIERRKFSTQKIWLITLDTTLPSALYQDNTLSITLDAFLQWVSPFVKIPSIEELFSKLIRNRFFPPEKIFDLKDFLIFYELDIRAKDLPPEDVEEAIRYLKSKFGEINPSDPDAFSEISYELARFFADPSREYQQEIRRAYEEQENLKKEYETKLGELQKQIEKISSQYQDKLREKDNELKTITKRLEQIEMETRREKLKISAFKRLLLTIFLAGLIEIGIISAIWKYGVGENLFQKLTNSWSWIATGVVVSIVLGWFIIGKERLIVLGWPFNKIFKISEHEDGDTGQ